MHDFRPVGLAQSGHAVFRDARMTNAVSFQQMPVDIGILGVNMENARAKLVDVCDRVDELA